MNPTANRLREAAALLRRRCCATEVLRLAGLARRYGATVAALAECMGRRWAVSTVRAAVLRLRSLGLLEPAGRRRWRVA
jgi:hypothetical protein